MLHTGSENNFVQMDEKTKVSNEDARIPSSVFIQWVEDANVKKARTKCTNQPL